MDTADIRKFIEANLTPKRLKHTEGVRETAVKLAGLYGQDAEKAEACALFHDMCRSFDIEKLNEKVTEYGLPERYIGNKNLAHGKAAAEMMKRDFGVTDPDMINAVSFHTTGRYGMSELEKIIYIADIIEPGRDFPGVSELRKKAFEDLDEACLMSVDHTVDYVLSQGSFLDGDTLEAKKYLEETIKSKRSRSMTSREYAMLAGNTLSQKKAQDTVLINIEDKASFADYFVIASGSSERQLNALCDDVEDALAKENLFPKSVEGKQNSGWILMDFGDIIVNIFLREARDKYNLEKIWGDCEKTFIED